MKVFALISLVIVSFSNPVLANANSLQSIFGNQEDALKQMYENPGSVKTCELDKNKYGKNLICNQGGADTIYYNSINDVKNLVQKKFINIKPITKEFQAAKKYCLWNKGIVIHFDVVEQINLAEWPKDTNFLVSPTRKVIKFQFLENPNGLHYKYDCVIPKKTKP